MRNGGRRVVVTGMGAVTSLGHDIPDTWAGVRDGRSGIRPITQFDTSTVATHFGGEVQGWDAESVIPRREARRMDRFAQFFIGAAQQAFDDAGLVFEEDAEAERAGAVIGSGLGGMLSFDQQLRVMWERVPRSRDASARSS